jgi:hypothetical protein
LHNLGLPDVLPAPLNDMSTGRIRARKIDVEL